jgi:LysM domain
MGTAGRSAPLRRTGSLVGLLGLELAAVLALHWLGRFAGLRIGWDEPVEWLASSPVQEVLGALLRTVGLVMAYWLLASTVLYLLASLTRLPAAVRAVSWATLPLARRVADHAVAVTLATSMVGGGTLGVAGPALAADGRSGMGPPARKPVAAAQATDSTAPQDAPATSAGEATEPSPPSYTPEVAGQAPTSGTEETTPPTPAPTAPAPTATEPTATEPTATEPTEPTGTAYTPDPAGEEPRRLPAPGQASSTASTKAPTTTTQPPNAAAAPATTAATTTSTTGLRDPAYNFNAATTTTVGPGEREPANDPGSGGPTESSGPGADEPTPEAGGETSREVVVEGDSIWTIAVANMPGEPTDQEVAEYVDLVAETNRDRLRSGDPDLIEPGETIILPPVAAGAEPAPEAGRNRHDVAEGESLWTIARDRLAKASGGGSGEPTNQEVTEYWAKVVEANQGRLESGDPDVIYPGETIILPPVD